MKYIFTTIALASTAYSWTVDFYLGSYCTGEELSSVAVDESKNTCVPVSVENPESALAVKSGFTKSTLTFYTGDSCSGGLLGTIESGGCLTFSLDGFGSIQVEKS